MAVTCGQGSCGNGLAQDNCRFLKARGITPADRADHDGSGEGALVPEQLGVPGPGQYDCLPPGGDGLFNVAGAAPPLESQPECFAQAGQALAAPASGEAAALA